MDKTLAELLGQAGLSSDIVESLQEAFDAKVAAAREEAELSIREEFARRYEHDHGQLVEAMDRMITTAVTEHAEKQSAEVAKLAEARKAFRNAVKESRAQYKTKLKEHVDLTNNFAVEQLSKEAIKLKEARSALVETRKTALEDLKALKESVAKQQAERVQKIDEFVVRNLSKELVEFKEDHRALVETRLKLVSEGRKKLKETQTTFIKHSAKKVEEMVNESLKREMTQLHEDLERNRQNSFGRRIFEAVAAEFMTSYLVEGTEIATLQTVVESKESELASLKSKLNEAEQSSAALIRKNKLAEDRAVRTKIMNELLSNLRGEKKQVMEGMLEMVKTPNLRESFNRLLPVVLNESKARPAIATAKPALMEEKKNHQEQRGTVVTGDRRARLEESVSDTDAEIDHELAQVIRLAGIK
jgi:hypothetical protein